MSPSPSSNLLFRNGVHVSDQTPPITTLLESHSGAYTTTRTHNNASRLLFWNRHVPRLSNSLKMLIEKKPEFLFGEEELNSTNLRTLVEKWEWVANDLDSVVESFVGEAMRAGMRIERGEGKEVAVTVLVSGNVGELNEWRGGGDGIWRCFNVYVHLGVYVVGVFGGRGIGARLAVMGRGREVAAAKYSDWARLRKPLLKLKLSRVTEILLSNDGNHILEGCVTNFFVVCQKDTSETQGRTIYEVQTAPISDGVLPGVIRQLVIEVCVANGIPLKEHSPAWSERHSWEEAFVTSSLRVLQHVETIEVPLSWSWEPSKLKSWNEDSRDVKHFKDGPGMITKFIQNEIMMRADLEDCRLSDWTD